MNICLRICVLAPVAALSALLVACGGKGEGPATAASAPAAAAAVPAVSAPQGTASGSRGGGPVSVTTAVAKQRDFDVLLESIGSVTPLASVDVKPQINSVVTSVRVQEGQFVRAGQVLLTLDARPDETNVAKLRAQLARDETLLADAQRQLARARDLLAKNFVSQGGVDTSQTQVEAQLAAVAADRAALDAALVSLSYTTVKAPGAGRLGAVNVYPGTSVQANQTTLLTITQLDPINVSFNLPQRNLGVALQGLKSGGASVQARLPDDKTAVSGKLLFVDNTVDAATGTVKVRARFANRDAKLWPGAFVKVSFVADTLKGAVVIPTSAVIQSTRGAIVYLADQGKAVLKPVTVLATQGEEVAVTGVAAGDKVVLEGRQNLRPDVALVERAPQAKAGARPASAPAS
ncbi:MAG: efflux RND transporter periplasmic adaptor subunit [Burkholderiales bacterium]|nr:efflux RND transporter periplasmic adaptor subunit [Burkholderiales bacterium]